MIHDTKRKPPRRSIPTYSERTDRIRAWGEAAKNCTPLIVRTLFWATLIGFAYWGAPTTLLTLAAIWAQPP